MGAVRRTPARATSRVTDAERGPIRDSLRVRLGLSVDATNVEILSELDTRLAQRTATKPTTTVDDFLAALAFGEHTGSTRSMLEPATTPMTAEDRALFKLAFGDCS